MAWTNIGSGLYPDLLLEWAPTTSPLAETPVWVDETDRLREFEWEYGRNDERQEFLPGRGFIVLANNDREFDPSNTSGSQFGNIKPRRLWRLRFRWDSTEYPIFLAHARGYPQTYIQGGKDKLVRIELTDDLATLQQADLDALGFNRPQERSDQRVDAILDAAEIPESRRDVQEGTVTVAATADQPSGSGSALTHTKQVVEDSEGWPLYVTRAGKVAFF